MGEQFNKGRLDISISPLASNTAGLGVSKMRDRRWLVWPLALLAVAALLFYEWQASSADSMSLEPAFSSPGGSYDDDIRLEISTGYPDAEIFFTLDGGVPDVQDGILYTEPLLLDAALPQVVVIRARAFLPDGSAGPVASATYFMDMDNSLPMLSIIVDPDDFWGEDDGIYVNHEQRGREWERPVDLTYVTNDGDGFHTGAGIRVHGGWTRFFSDKKSLRLYFRDEYGARKLEYPLFGQTGQIAFDHLILHNSSKDLLLFRNQLVERLADDMGGFATRSQPALVFINGRPWGIYNIREQIDERLLAENYQVPGADISDTPNNRGMQSEEQLAVDTVHWENLMEFVLANDLTIPENYAYVQTQMDLSNFIDYYLLQMFVANSDWPHHNVHQFRPRNQGGRWEWIPWDNDLAFINVGQQMVNHVLNVDHPLGERMEILFNKLLANPEFHNLFLTRAADLLNTTLSTSNVLAHIEELAMELTPDVGQEKARWDIAVEWDDTLAHIREFAAKRPDIMRQHFIDSFELNGAVELKFEQAVEGDPGWIVVNDSNPQQLPWQGTYFLGTNLKIRAIPPPGQVFIGWVEETELGLGDSATIEIMVDRPANITPQFSDAPDMTYMVGDVSFNNVHINDEGDIEGDWFELKVNRVAGVDLGGWRVSDNDSVEANDEGSFVFDNDPLLETLQKGTTIRVITTQTKHNAQQFPEDGWQDGVLLLYAGNGMVDSIKDPWFNLGQRDNLVVYAPGPTAELIDDIPIGFWSNNTAVRPSDFGLPPDIQEK